MKTLGVLIASLLFASSLCTITTKAAMGKHSLILGDYFYEDLNDFFDLSQVSYPLITEGINAMANNQTQAYVSRHFQVFQFQKLNWVQQVTEDSLVFCYDNKNIVVQVMKGEGKTFGYYQKFTLSSVDVVCHDVAHYEHRSQLFVGCVSKNSTPANPGAVYVATWDYTQQKVTNIEITKQDDGFRILNRIGLFISEKTASGSKSPTPYLVLYDTGNTNAMQRKGDDYIRVYRNVSIGTLRFYQLMKVDDHQYDILHNIFPYQETLILSGRVTGPTSQVITLAQCQLDFKKSVVSCDSRLKTTTVTKGMVGLNFLNQYFEINSETSKIRVAHLRGDFHDNNWNRDLIHSMNNLQLLSNENAYIRYYTGNWVLGTINYGVVGGGSDFGYTGISYSSGINWSVEGSVAANLGHSIIYGQVDQSGEHEGDVISIMRPDHPYILVDSHNLPLGQSTTVGVSATDEDTTSPVSTSSTFTVVSTIYDKINIFSSAFGDIQLIGGHTSELQLHDSDIVQGNALKIKATSSDNSVHGESYSGAVMKIQWNPSHDNNDIIKYAFFENKAVVQNNRGSIWFYNCRRLANVHDRKCDQYANYPGTVSQPIRGVSVVNGVLFTWTCNNTDCFAIFVQNSGEVATVSLGPGILSAFAGVDNQVPNWLRLVVISQGTVEIFRASQFTPQGMTLWYTVDQSNAYEDWFCPTKVYHCPDNEDVLEILNDCQNYNQKILKYKIGDVSVTMMNKTNLDSLTQSPFFCPMGSEFIVGSTSSQEKHPLYSFGTHDDLNFWTVPKDLLGDSFWQYSCLSHAKRFVTYGFNKDGTLTASVLVGNRGSDQLKRYSNVIPGITATDAHAYEGIDNSVVHWFNTAQGPLFFETYDTPILELSAKKVTQSTQVDVTLTFTNNGTGKKVITKKVTINP